LLDLHVFTLDYKMVIVVVKLRESQQIKRY